MPILIYPLPPPGILFPNPNPLNFTFPGRGLAYEAFLKKAVRGEIKLLDDDFMVLIFSTATTCFNFAEYRDVETLSDFTNLDEVVGAGYGRKPIAHVELKLPPTFTGAWEFWCDDVDFGHLTVDEAYGVMIYHGSTETPVVAHPVSLTSTTSSWPPVNLYGRTVLRYTATTQHITGHYGKDYLPPPSYFIQGSMS